MNRRTFLKQMGIAGAASLMPSLLPPLARRSWGLAGDTSPKDVMRRRKVMVLGIDGMDVRLTHQFLESGLLPNIAKLVKHGALTPMQTSTPPQSPVAWSNVIVGGTPALHGIYDFIHRDPHTLRPYLSTSAVKPPQRVLHIGEYQIPLTAGETRLLRSGTPFWEPLEQAGIPATIFKIPANFPCQGGSTEMVSGMGTPDLRGGYGNYTLFTTAPDRYPGELTGGILIPLHFNRNRCDTRLPGPPNSLKEGSSTVEIPLTIWRDKKHPVVRVRLPHRELVLKAGEWSGWQEIEFPLMGGLHTVSGICKIYIKQVYPHFSMYVSPININPADAALPVVSPADYGKRLVEAVGYFYTQGFPEDTKALSEGILSEKEYLSQAKHVFQERSRLLDYELSRFEALETGLLFFYFSSLDQNSHMYWRLTDKRSPLYTPELARDYGRTILTYYTRVDRLVERILSRMDIRDPRNTLMLMSDHGFGAFNRQVNLNTWLYENGYLALDERPGSGQSGEGYFTRVNWARTGAYNVGINGLYLNRRGREERGIVTDGQAKHVLKRLAADLTAARDPQTGEPMVKRVFEVDPVDHQRHPHAPDLIVGWNHGYRNSWKSILGTFEPIVFQDNLDKWSGDHCIDPGFVPAILISNKKMIRPAPCLSDMGPTILAQFGLAPPSSMTGSPVLHG